MIKFISYKRWEEFRVEEIECADFDALPSIRICDECGVDGGSDCDCYDGCVICDYTQFVWCESCGGEGFEALQTRDDREIEAISRLAYQHYIDDVVESCKKLVEVGCADLLTAMADFFRQHPRGCHD